MADQSNLYYIIVKDTPNNDFRALEKCDQLRASVEGAGGEIGYSLSFHRDLPAYVVIQVPLSVRIEDVISEPVQSSVGVVLPETQDTRMYDSNERGEQ